MSYVESRQWNHTKQERLDRISAELLPLTQTKSLSDAGYKRMNALTDEGIALAAEKQTYEKAKSMGSYAAPSEYGIDGNPGDSDNGFAFNGFAPGMENRIAPTSLYSMDKSQIAALRQAGLQKTGFRVQIGSKGIEHGFMGGQLRSKAAVTEGGLTPNLLPPIQQLGPRGFWGLPYELTRVANFLPNVAMDGPGLAYFQHTTNSVEAGYVAEGRPNPISRPPSRRPMSSPPRWPAGST